MKSNDFNLDLCLRGKACSRTDLQVWNARCVYGVLYLLTDLDHSMENQQLRNLYFAMISER